MTTLPARVLAHMQRHPRASIADLMAATESTHDEVIAALVGRHLDSPPPPVWVDHEELRARMKAKEAQN